MLPPAEQLFLNEAFSDVELKVQSGDGYTWRFPAHSIFLSAGSGWMKERIEELGLRVDDSSTATASSTSSANAANASSSPASPDAAASTVTTITIVDISADSLLMTIKYLYTGELPPFLHVDVLLELLGSSIRFQIPDLKSDCEKRILDSLRVLNVGYVLERATDLLVSGRGSASIVEACRRLMLRYGQIIFSSELVHQMNRRNLEYIVASEKLNVVNESVVFDGIWRWGRQNCCKAGLPLTDKNIVDCLGEILEHVRFSSLRDNDLPEEVKDRFCTFSHKRKLCCTILSDGVVPVESRCPYRIQGDLLHQSSRKLLSAYVTPNTVSKAVESPPLNDRVMCIQLSFSCTVFMTAVALEAFPGTTSLGSYILTVTSESNGVEVHREKVLSFESLGDRGSEVFSTVLRMSVPVKMNRRSDYSLHLFLEEKVAEDVEQTSNAVDEVDIDDDIKKSNKKNWMFPCSSVRRNISPPDDQECHMATHCEKVVAVTAVYFLPGADKIW